MQPMFKNDDYMNVQLPSWMDISGAQQPQSQPAQGGGFSFVDALKKRLSSPQMKQGEQGAALGKAAVAPKTGGGAPTSL